MLIQYCAFLESSICLVVKWFENWGNQRTVVVGFGKLSQDSLLRRHTFHILLFSLESTFLPGIRISRTVLMEKDSVVLC